MTAKKSADAALDEVLALYNRAFKEVQEKVCGPEIGARADHDTLKLAVEADIGISGQAIELVRLALDSQRLSEPIGKKGL